MYEENTNKTDVSVLKEELLVYLKRKIDEEILKAKKETTLTYGLSKLSKSPTVVQSKKQKPSKLNLIKNTFFDWSKSVNIDCYAKIIQYEHNTFAKIAWLLVLIGSLVVTFWLLSLNIRDYLKYEVVSAFDRINEHSTDFPTITICNVNPFTTLYSQSLMENVAASFGFGPWHAMWNPNISDVTKIHAANPLFGDANRRLLGFPVTEIKWCYSRYGNDLFDESCYNNLHWIYLYQFGNCYQFNSGLNLSNHAIDLVKTTTDSTGFNSFRIKIMPRLENKYMISPYADGFMVFIHNKSYLPTYEDGVYAELGKFSSIRVKRTFTHKVPYPYSDCIDLTTYTSELYDFIVASNRTYRQKDCIDLCKQKRAIDQCGCFNMRYPNIDPRVRPCLNVSENHCVYNQIKNIFEAGLLNKCIQEFCPLECDSSFYDLSVSSLEYPSLANCIALQYGSYIQCKRDHIFLEVSYSSLEYTEITQTPKMSGIDLLSQSGGSLSMCVSLSIFSLFEITEVILLLIYVAFFKKARVNMN